jgi:hypothetical protein
MDRQGARCCKKRRHIDSPVAFAIQSGEKITALTGKVITRQFGIIKMLKQ